MDDTLGGKVDKIRKATAFSSPLKEFGDLSMRNLPVRYYFYVNRITRGTKEEIRYLFQPIRISITNICKYTYPQMQERKKNTHRLDQEELYKSLF